MVLAEIPMQLEESRVFEQNAHFLSTGLLDTTHHQPEHHEYGYDLFRSAIVERDEEAWGKLLHEYEGQMITWIWKCVGGRRLLEEGLGQQLINTAFANLAQSLTATKFSRYETLGTLLQYLKRCSSSAVSGEMRSRRKHRVEDVDLALLSSEQEPHLQDTADVVLEELTSRNFWQAIARELPDRDDRLLVYLFYWLGMTIDAIHHHYPSRFPTRAAAAKRRRNILLRLRRSHSLLRMLADIGFLPLDAENIWGREVEIGERGQCRRSSVGAASRR